MGEHRNFNNSSIGSLYLVPTPIGNLDDITFRAVNTLKDVDLIAAEDTRNTQKLLNHLEIDTKQISFHEHNKMERIPELVEKMLSGLDIAQVSDAGTPSISDPGKELVQAAIKSDISVISLPGATASVTALVASGIDPQPFTFYGFLDRKGAQRQAVIDQIVSSKSTSIIYESPYRVVKTLSDIEKISGPKRQIVTARELTKIHESYNRGTIFEVRSYFERNNPKGEFVIIISGDSEVKQYDLSDDEIIEQINMAISDGEKPNKAIKDVAKKFNLDKKEIYNLYHQIGE